MHPAQRALAAGHDRQRASAFLDSKLKNATTAVEQYSVYDPTFGSGGLLSQLGDVGPPLSPANERLSDVVPFSMSQMAAAIKQANQIIRFPRKAQEDVALNETERRALIKARIGQAAYRTQLLSYWGGCAVTGCTNVAMLRASHAKPWHASLPAERIDPFNGLLLVPNLDQAFDQGLISFDDDGAILISKMLDSQTATLLGITPHLRLRQVAHSHLPYLTWHRNFLFRM